MTRSKKYSRKLTTASTALLMAASIMAGPGTGTLVSGPISIFAEAMEREISLDPGQGSVSQSSVNVDAQGKLGNLPTPSRTGWTFDGWYTEPVTEKLNLEDPTNETRYWRWDITSTGKKVSSGESIDGNISQLYASYKPTHINLNLKPSGWLGQKGSLSIGREYGVPFSGIVYGWTTGVEGDTKDNYVFDGWYTALDGGTKITTVGALPDKSEVPASYTPLTGQDLYMHWHSKDGSHPANQVEWSNSYGSSSTIISSLTSNVAEPCIHKEVELTAWIPNTDNFWQHLDWKIVSGNATLQSFSAKKCLVKPKSAGSVTVEATLTDGDNKGQTIQNNKRKAEITINFHDHDAAHLKHIEYQVVKNKYRSYDYCEVCHVKLNEKEFTKDTDPNNTGISNGNNGGSNTNGSGNGGSNGSTTITPPANTTPSTPSTQDPAVPETPSVTEPQQPQPTQPEVPSAPSQPEATPQPEQPAKNEVQTIVPEPPVLSETVVDSKTETTAAGAQETVVTFDDGHTDTKVESVQASTSYVESADHSFAGAEIDIKESTAQEVKVEIKAIPLSTQATQPIVLKIPDSGERAVSIPVENGNWGTVALLVDDFGEVHEINASYYDGQGNLIVPVTSNMKVVLQNKALTFADVQGPINEYPANNIAFLSARGIMSGKGDGTNFDPTGEVTRGQLALMLYRIAGEPTGYNNTPAPAGVAEDSYYANAAKWAVGTGLMGQGGSAFNGDRAVKRENLALILYRQSSPQSVSINALESYHDALEITSTDAAAAISWSIENGIMGNGTKTLNPQSQSMRQDVAAMIARWIQPAISQVK